MEQRLTHYCGTRLEEWDPAEGGDVQAYVAELWVCPGCKMRQDALDSEHKKNKGIQGINTNGLEVRLVPQKLHARKVALKRDELQRKHDEEIEERRRIREDGEGTMIGSLKTPR